MSATLLAESISRSFGGRRILSSARLSAASGEVVGILGRMGTGKSTLLKICVGMLESPTGWVRFAGHQHTRPHLSTLAARGMFYLAELDNLSRAMTVEQHFEKIEQRFGVGDRSSAIDFLSLGDLLESRVDMLSGGEVKRVEMALALVRRPLCLIADEPFRSADPLICQLLGESFKRLASQGCAVVVSGHEVNLLRPFLDSVTWVTSGTTYRFGSTEAAWSDEAFAREYLGSGTHAS
jgi:lipopolysaccharide export system ATP-binding protein